MAASGIAEARMLVPAFILAATLLVVACATPYGDASPLGGAVETQLSADMYSIATRINGHSPGGLLKPLLLRRARELGKSRGYGSFAIETVDIGFNIPGLSYRAKAVVRFSNQRLIPRSGVVYAVDAPDPYRASLDPADAKRLAKLSGSDKRGLEQQWSLTLVPVFLDAVTAKASSYEAISFLSPGAQKFFVHYWFSPTPYSGLESLRQGFVLFERPLEASKSYVMVGSYKEGVIELWLEDDETKGRVGESEFVRLKAGT